MKTRTFIKLYPLKTLLLASLVFLVTVVALLPASPVAYACVLPDGSTGVTTGYPHTNETTCCPAGASDSIHCLYAKYLNPLVRLLSAAVGVIVVIALIVGAIEYITSAGDPQKAASGRKRIVNALLGLVAFILLYAFLQFIVPGGLLNG